LGPFSAAYSLREKNDLTRQDRTRLNELLGWFVAELTVPPPGSIPARALFWYADVGQSGARRGTWSGS
jgi:hypothetical protein